MSLNIQIGFCRADAKFFLQRLAQFQVAFFGFRVFTLQPTYLPVDAFSQVFECFLWVVGIDVVEGDGLSKSCDAVVCAGVHSQLFSLLSYSWKVLAANVSEQIFRRAIKEEWFHEMIRGWNDGIIPMLDKAMIHAAKKKALFGCEYDPVSPIEGAYQCVTDLRRNSSEIGSLVWPFDPEHGKQYVMRFFLCNNS